MPTQQEKLLQRLVELTEAVKELAARPDHPPVEPPASVGDAEYGSGSDADRVRRRVAFSYQALGTLTGRVSTATGHEFDVPVVGATRHDDRIVFAGLPPDAHWVELRTGTKVEPLRIERSRDEQDEHGRSSGAVSPRRFAASEPIGSTVFLRTAKGPLLAFGPRLAPVEPAEPDAT